jgi:uncharacterized protein GlcG (DUF336 family)
VVEESVAGMTLDLAEECIRRVKLKAAAMGIELSIAVVNETGKLIAYVRMGDHPAGFGEKLAIAKAKTAAAYRRTTLDCLQRFGEYPANNYIITMSAMYPGEFCVTPGGVPILTDGRLVGAIGVSGSTPENDHQCAQEIVESLVLN